MLYKVRKVESMKEYKLYINGKWIETTSGKIINDYGYPLE